MARSNGGIIGKINKSSFGKCKVTSKTSTGTITTQPGTRIAQVLVVAHPTQLQLVVVELLKDQNLILMVILVIPQLF